MKFSPGDFVHKHNHHKFQGWVLSVGTDTVGDSIVTVEHWPEGWKFCFRADQLVQAPKRTYDTR